MRKVEMEKQRVSKALILNLVSEGVNKLVPLVIFVVVAKRLGVESFGFSQYGITLFELSFPLIILGYNHYGAVLMGRHADNPSYQNQLFSDFLALKLAQALGVWILALGVTHSFRAFYPYQSLALAGGVIFLLAAIDVRWLYLSKQKLGEWALFSTFGKIIGLMLILYWVQGPDDAVLFAFLYLIMGFMVNGWGFLKSLALVKLVKPKWTRMVQLFWSSRSFGILLVTLIVMERVDMNLIQLWFGDRELGLYGASNRVCHSLLQLLFAISSVFYGEIIANHTKDGLTRSLGWSLWAILCILVPVALGVFFVSSELMGVLLGAEYKPAGPLLAVMVQGVLAQVVCTTVGAELLAVKNQLKKAILGFLGGIFLMGGLGQLAMTVAGPELIHLAVAMVVAKYGVAGLMIFFARNELGSLPWRRWFEPILAGGVMALGLFFWQPEGLLATLGLGAGLYGVALGVLGRKTFLRLLAR